MPNALNTAFVANPAAFIAGANHGVGGHDDLLQATKGTRDQLWQAGSDGWRAAQTLTRLIDATNTISFDFHAYTRGATTMALLTPIADPTMFHLPGSVTQHFQVPSTNPVRGYWFPYIALTPQQHRTARYGLGPPSVMGWVDIPKLAPTYNFAFTGSMQGCHIVVTQSPANPVTHFRVYHYPSPGTYWSTMGNMAFNHWPSHTGGRPVAWLDDTMYGNPPNDVDAFNFLYFNGANWVILTQQQHRQTLLLGGMAVVLFTVVGSFQTAIPDRPLSMGALYTHARTWQAARGLGNPG